MSELREPDRETGHEEIARSDAFTVVDRNSSSTELRSKHADRLIAEAAAINIERCGVQAGTGAMSVYPPDGAGKLVAIAYELDGGYDRIRVKPAD